MKIRLRKVDQKDRDVLLNWRNHSRVSSNSYNRHIITLQDHQRWFENILSSQFIFTYILESDNIPVGVIRFENEGSSTTRINYLIDPSYHGKGFGTRILQEGLKENKLENSTNIYFGYVLKTNIASIKIFEKLHFVKVSENDSELKFEKTVE